MDVVLEKVTACKVNNQSDKECFQGTETLLDNLENRSPEDHNVQVYSHNTVFPSNIKGTDWRWLCDFSTSKFPGYGVGVQLNW